MGLDGGLITHRPDMVKTKNNTQARVENSQRSSSYSKSCWVECALTGSPLHAPILVSKFGTFFNKNDALNAIAEGTVPNRIKYIRHLKNLKEVDLLGFPNLLEYVCPVSGKSPSPGTQDSWVIIFKCGHLFLEYSLVQLNTHVCPICGAEFTEDDLINVTNPKKTHHKHTEQKEEKKE
ncbi:protein RTF2 [Histomonas meleagridis]|uniref:protein RTF2-like n=1 Tax=Histomonas meleagridis TaxID=135588 RepID=UPI0035594B59|nr:protein RTF2 [Histomonas meleagridis]KAH0800866.1 protein RTF2-like [Histomonas meleagridis]